jgi:hypothetical protein
MHATLFALPLLTLGALAQGPLGANTADPTPPANAFVATSFRGLCLDDAADPHGRHWARGETYKAGFGAGEVTYVPLLGITSPTQTLQLTLRRATVGSQELPLQAAPAPRLGDHQVTFERGACTEHWDLMPTQAEQSFAFARLPAQGDLVLDLAVTTTLQFGERDTAGLVFAAPGFGTVHYSDAVLVDANGRRTPLSTACSGDGIRITAAAATLATAAFPIVIDPVLSTRSYDTSTADSTDPDLCYDATRDVWLLVNTEKVSNADGDIRCRRFSPTGTLLSDTYAESSTDDAGGPHVGNHRAQSRFLVGWSQVVSVINYSAFVREHSTQSAGQGSPVLIESAVQGIADVDVGGSTESGGLFLVTWTTVQVALTVHLNDVHCRTYSLGGTLGAAQDLALNVGCGGAVACSRTAGPHQNWAVVWTENSTSCLGGDIAGAVIAGNGTVAQSRFLIDGSNVNFDFNPDVAGDGQHFVAVWHRSMFSPRTIMGVLIGPSATGFATLTSTLNMTQLEPGASVGNDQTTPCIEWDGCRYAYGYSEGSPARPFYATLAFQGISPVFYEGHIACSTAASTVAHSSIHIASEGSSGGAPGICHAVWQQVGNGRDLRGVEFDLRAATGGVTRINTHCPTTAGAFTTIDSVGTPALGRTITLQLGSVVALPFIIAGVQTPIPVALCPTSLSSCRRGVQLPTLVAQFGSSLAVSIPCAVGLVGFPLAFQGIDLGATNGCSAATFGVPFRVTDTLVVRIQ